MNRVSKLPRRYFSNKDMTIAIDDARPSQTLTERKKDLLLKGYEKVNHEIISYNGKKMQIQPGCTLEETLEKVERFVQNSYYTGLSPTEVLSHTMSVREGLVDTAVKTTETGYMQRSPMNALGDLSILHDYSVRRCDTQIVQYIY
ncbi:hypothetical protein PFDG_05122 [Plasmodium falciparum Dd2]|uniref:DNA-directed RNA polymerase n=1 Tax=Plasmodium falciparum (isolate Dd2) TaxID=57267 RepID=A0A0L7M9T8_PLAF4|nr:hypothetical protein PFDG_05122 [Plasmodium falciparum Dd2]